LAQANQYIYIRVQEIIGKNAKEIFALMCKFSDRRKPLSINALDDENYMMSIFVLIIYQKILNKSFRMLL